MVEPLLLIGWSVLLFDVAATLAVLYFERKDMARAAPWLIAVFLGSFVGFAFYLLFGFDYFKSRHFKLKAGQDRRILKKIVSEQELGLDLQEQKNGDERMGRLISVARMLLMDNDAFLTSKNRVEVFTDGAALYDRLLNAIASARHHIHVEYYLIRDDEAGRKLLELLTKKATEGVEVRFLYDNMGNRLKKKWYRGLVEAGGRTSGFYKSPIAFVGFRVNYRNHRKIVVVDGTVGFVGGFNIGEEYLGDGPLGYWRDTAIELQGDGVKALQLRFMLDWNFATKEDLGYREAYFPIVDMKEGPLVQVVNGGPDTPWEPVKLQYMKMVNIARKSIYIQTPYFIPDESLLDSVRMAALSGVDVRIMIPSKPDHPLVYWGSLSYVGELLETGAKAYRYEGGFLHAKTVVVDDLCASIGTTNWDIRSFKSNFESNVVVYEEAFVEQQRRIFERDLQRSRELTKEEYAKRGRVIRTKEALARLFSPLL